TRSPEHGWLVEGSVAMLGDVLGQWQEISVVREGRLYPALRRHGLTPGGTPDEQAVRRVAEETGGWTVVSGDVLATGENVRIRARAYDAVTGREVARAEEIVGRGEDITAAFGRLGFIISGATDLVRRPDWISARATTRSLDAYKAYLRGLMLYSSRTDVPAALEAFREAVALDSTFALAHALLAMTYGAEVVLFDNPEAMAAFVNPQSEANRAMQRATALSARLPPWERRLMQAISAVFRAQFTDARRALEDLLAAEPTDEVMGLLAVLEMYDAIMVTENGVERRRGSLNAAARLAKRMIYVNPARHDALAFLVRIYREAAGYWVGWSGGFRRELASLVDYAMSPADLLFVPVLRDTIEFIQVSPIDSLRLLPEDSVEAARARARTAARGWVDQWLAAAPPDARAQSWVSHILELDGDLAAAFGALRAAESVAGPVQRGRFRPRRMVLLGKLGRRSGAAALLDSIWADGRLATRQFSPLFPRDRFVALAWAVGLWLSSGQLERADSAYALLELEIPGSLKDYENLVAAALTGSLPRPSKHWWALSAAQLPAGLVLEGLDALLQNIRQLAPDGSLARNVPYLLRGASRRAGAEDRSRLAATAMDAALALADAEREAVALELAWFAVEVEPGLRDRVAGQPWYRARRPL
ncbi:MAG: hypothetical protein ACE5JM_09780, partial [Armatimonadota bacterium]